MAAVAGKYLIKNEIIAHAGRHEILEDAGFPMKAGGATHQQY